MIRISTRTSLKSRWLYACAYGYLLLAVPVQANTLPDILALKPRPASADQKPVDPILANAASPKQATPNAKPESLNQNTATNQPIVTDKKNLPLFLPAQNTQPSLATEPTAPSDSFAANDLMPVSPPPVPESDAEKAAELKAQAEILVAKQKKYQNNFEKAYDDLVPLSPESIREVMGRYERTQKAAVPPEEGQPKGDVRVKTLSLEPGSEPPTINVAAGYVTTITIVDSSGEPWPILDLGIGGNFEVSKTGAGAQGNHVVRIMPLTRFGYGNLSVILQDLPTPIIFKLASGSGQVDYRFDARIPKIGPNAKASLIDQRLQAGSATIMTLLDNAPPPDAKRVRVNGTDSRTMAWMINERLFVRTSLTLLSPSWEASVASADGTTVYELDETPMLLMSDSGVLVRARITPAEKDDAP